MTPAAQPLPAALEVLASFVVATNDAVALLGRHGELVAWSRAWQEDYADQVLLPDGPDESTPRLRFLRTTPAGPRAPVDVLAIPVPIDDAGGPWRATLVLARAFDAAPTPNRFLALIESLPFAIGVHRDFHFVYVNREACAYLGYPEPSCLVGSPIMSILSPDEHANAAERVAHMVRTGEPLPERPTRLLRADGHTVTAEVSAFPIADFDGRPSYVVVARDVTERFAYEARLQQAQRMEAVGRLAGGIAHDFNNVLSVILSYSDLLTSELPDGSASFEAAHEIRSAARRAADMTRRLLTMSRSQPDGPTAPVASDPVVVAEGLMSLLSRLAGRDVQLRLHGAPGVFTVTIGASELEQVLLNLVINARDALDGRGVVEIAVDDGAGRRPPPGLGEGPWVRVAVADDGPGMSELVRVRAFEPFFTTKAPQAGTGLGLSTVFGIARQAGGIATLDAREGGGTEASVWLPRTQPPPSVGSAPSAVRTDAPRASGGPPTVVAVVEDDDAVRTMIVRVLRREGHLVLAAASGEEMRERLTDQGAVARPDVLVTDVVMGDCSGPALAVSLRERWPRLPVLFVSGYTDDMLDREHMVGGPTAFLPKPFTPRELGETVTALVRDASPMRPPSAD